MNDIEIYERIRNSFPKDKFQELHIYYAQAAREVYSYIKSSRFDAIVSGKFTEQDVIPEPTTEEFKRFLLYHATHNLSIGQRHILTIMLVEKDEKLIEKFKRIGEQLLEANKLIKHLAGTIEEPNFPENKDYEQMDERSDREVEEVI